MYVSVYGPAGREAEEAKEVVGNAVRVLQDFLKIYVCLIVFGKGMIK